MKTYVFDADGVLAIPGQLFSHMYAERYGLSIEPFQQFFREQFSAALVGQADLRELIVANKDTWPYGTAEEILDDWFSSENVQDEQALATIKEIRQRGHKCYLATNQEKYRGNYMKTVMFPGLFDGYFISGEIGAKKPDVEFFRHVVAKIQDDAPGTQAQDIIFFDDTPEHVEGAKQVGIDARYYTDIRQLTDLLR